MPTEVDAGDNAASRLASMIAETIRDWLDRKEILSSRARPIRAGDILILVQSRGPIVELLMRALKSRDVPVAGVDRMMLTQEIVCGARIGRLRCADDTREVQPPYGAVGIGRGDDTETPSFAGAATMA